MADEGTSQNDFEEGSVSSGSESDAHVSESLSDINDADISRYINTKEQVLLKTMMWEAMYRDYDENKKSGRKRARKAKEPAGGPPKKAAKTSESTTADGNKRTDGKKRSSKINYDALRKLSGEDGLESNERVNNVEHTAEAEDGGNDYNYESEHENVYNEDADEGYRYGDDDDTYPANDDYNGYNYDDDEYNYNGYNYDDDETGFDDF